MVRVLSALIIGLVFGSGIALSGMANPAKVLNFFDFAGTWDPSLAFVMGGALIVTAIGYAFVLRREAPVFDRMFHLSPRRDLDFPLIAGSAVFGIGWGITGFCPGGAIPALGLGHGDAWLFVGSMVGGIAVARLARHSAAARDREGNLNMWPFNLFWKSGKMNIKKIDDRFATTGQVRPEDVAQLARDGYVAIVCARPDNEEPGQPAFAAVAREAEKHGMKAIHIPVAGAPSAAQVDRFEEALEAIDGPVLGYCRSGARSAALYSLIGQ